MTFQDSKASSVIGILIILCIIIGGGGMFLTGLIGFDEINDTRVVGVWESIDNESEHIVFEGDNQGYINTSLFFIWKMASKDADKLYYILDFSKMNIVHVCYLDANNVNMMHYNGQIYLKKRSAW
jgi:hypothetical protein